MTGKRVLIVLRAAIRRRIPRWFGLMLIMAGWGHPLIAQAGGLTYTGTLRLVSGSYIDTTRTTSYYLFSYVRYTAGRFQAGASTAFVLQNTDLVANSGAGMIPFNRQHGGGQRRHTPSPGGGDGPGPMMRPLLDGRETRRMTAGLGDLFINADYTLLEGNRRRPMVTGSAQLKLPTAKTSTGFGTGEFDGYAGLVLGQTVGTGLVLINLGYLILGDPPGLTFRNAMSYGISYGQSLRNGRYTATLFFSGLTRIVEEYAPPRELSAGLHYRASAQAALNVGFSLGLSETVSDVGFSIGTTLTLLP